MSFVPFIERAPIVEKGVEFCPDCGVDMATVEVFLGGRREMWERCADCARKLVSCEECGVLYGVGCSPWCKDRHTPVVPRGGFEPGFDVGLGEYVTGWGDIRQHMREKKLEFKDNPSPGDVSARRDRIEEKRKAARR